MLSQFNNLLVILLIVASLLSFQLGSYRDGIVLAIIVVVNALIGFYQDWKSENILQSLKNFTTGSNRIVAERSKALNLSFKTCFSSISLFLVS